MKKVLTLLLILFLSASAFAQEATRQSVENGIAASDRLVAAHNWPDAFKTLRSVDASIGAGHPELHYLVSKQRFSLYKRINRHKEAREHLNNMETFAKSSGDKAVVNDMLLAKAAYFAAIGNMQGANACYKEMFEMRSKGADFSATEKCFKDMIHEAKAGNNAVMSRIIGQMYTEWQDSVASARAAAELKKLQADYASLQDISESKDTKIIAQWGSIVVLVIIAVALAVVMIFFMLTSFKKTRTIKKLRSDLKVSNENNAQKTVFISNISKQMTPSLDEIASGNKLHITALQGMLQHIENYMQLETASAEEFEAADANVEQLCKEVASKANNGAIPVAVDAWNSLFPVCKDVLSELLCKLVNEVALSPSTERITIGFKKRNPHTAQFFVTATGLKYSPEEKELLFTAFARVYDLSESDGLTYPTCALMAHKMGGAISIDSEFAKGTRFLVEVHC